MNILDCSARCTTLATGLILSLYKCNILAEATCYA